MTSVADDIRRLQPPCWQGMEAFPGKAPNKQYLKGLPSTKRAMVESATELAHAKPVGLSKSFQIGEFRCKRRACGCLSLSKKPGP